MNKKYRLVQHSRTLEFRIQRLTYDLRGEPYYVDDFAVECPQILGHAKAKVKELNNPGRWMEVQV